MMRVYAITLGAATQTVLLLPVALTLGKPDGLLGDLVLISGWVINLSLAEVLIRSRSMPRPVTQSLTAL